LRVFLDTNVLVSAFATRGQCEALFRHILAEHDLVTGEVVLAELETVLAERFHLPGPTVANVLALLREYPSIPRPAAPAPVEIRDPDDAWVLASALAAEADVLVTGDRDLLALSGSTGILITDPRGFWDLLKQGG
jgi:uncharacterized protein